MRIARHAVPWQRRAVQRALVVVGVAVLASVGASTPAHADERYTCAALLEQLRVDLRDEEAGPIRLTDPPTEHDESSGGTVGEPCDGFDDAGDVQRGRLDGRRATARSDGPHGSGHFWRVFVAVQDRGTVVGACFSTVTTWWRNLPDAGRARFGKWRLFHGNAVHVWSTLVAGGDEWSSVMLPLVLRLDKDQLALDRAATTVEIARAGRNYAKVARMRDDPAPELHRAAAAAFAAFAAGTDCAR
jgi:hypothetical protein